MHAYAKAAYSDFRIGLTGDAGFATWPLRADGPNGVPVRYRGVDILAFEGDLIKVKDAYRKERSTPIG